MAYNKSFTMVSYCVLYKLIENNPTVNRRTATFNLYEDLEKLYVAFIDVNNVKKHISFMKRTLKSSEKSDRDILNAFWKNHSNELKNLALKDVINLYKVISSVKDTATSSITNKRSISYQLTVTRAKKIQGVPESVYKNEQENIAEECDGITVSDNTDSIGAIIKSGESVNPSSTDNKNEQYSQSSYIKLLKIDFRLLVDLSNGEEVDIAAGECALFADDDKAIEDEGKLTRESKDDLDKIVKIVNNLGNNTC